MINVSVSLASQVMFHVYIQSIKANIFLYLIKSTVIGYYNATMNLQLAIYILGIKCHIATFSCKLLSTKKKKSLFYVEFLSPLISSFIKTYILSYPPKCLLVLDLVQTLTTRLLILQHSSSYCSILHSAHGRAIKTVAG